MLVPDIGIAITQWPAVPALIKLSGGKGRVMLAFHMFCAETMEQAIRVARPPFNHYSKTLVAAAADWTDGLNSKDYPNYDNSSGAFRRRLSKRRSRKEPPGSVRPKPSQSRFATISKWWAASRLRRCRLTSVRSPSRTPSAPCVYSPKRLFRQRSRISRPPSVMSRK
jgi:hypothetical protein